MLRTDEATAAEVVRIVVVADLVPANPPLSPNFMDNRRRFATPSDTAASHGHAPKRPIPGRYRAVSKTTAAPRSEEACDVMVQAYPDSEGANTRGIAQAEECRRESRCGLEPAQAAERRVIRRSFDLLV